MNRYVKGLALLSILVCSGALIGAEANKALSKSVYNKLARVEKLMAEQAFAEAQRKLDILLQDLPSRDTDKAYIYHSQGTLYLYQDQYKQAQEYYLLSYRLEALNEKTAASLTQTLASLAMHFGQYREAVTYLKACLEYTDPPPAKQVYLALGTAYYQLKEYENALPPLETAISRFKPDKSVHLMLFSAYYELAQLGKAASVLEKVIRIWPEEGQYWLQLASIYLEQKKYDRSLEVLQLAFTRGLLIEQSNLLQYVYTLYEKDLSYKAATVLAQAMQNALVERNHKNYSLLATLYVEAREEDLALEAFKMTSRHSSDGKEELYIAQIYFEKERFGKAAQHARAALDKGIRNPGTAYMLMAASYHELGKNDKAKSNLLKASKYEKTKKSALRWLEEL